MSERGAMLMRVGAAARRRGWIVAPLALLLTVVVYGYSAVQPAQYEATMIVEADQTGSSTTIGGSVIPNPNAAAVLVGYGGTGSVQVAARTARDGPRPIGSVGGLTASVDPRTGWIVLIGSGASPEVATKGVTVYYHALAAYAQARSRRLLDRAIVATRRSLPALHERKARGQAIGNLSQLLALRAVPPRPLRLIQAAQANKTGPNPGRNALLALALAVLLAPPLVLLLERRDRRVQRAPELERLADASVLATVPWTGLRRAGRADDERPFQRVRDTLEFGDPGPETLAVVGPLRGSGTTTVAVGLALAFARAGKRTLLVDADLQDGDVADRLGVPASPGLSDLIDGYAAAPASHTVLDGEDLHILPSGSPPADPDTVLGSKQTAKVMRRLFLDYDRVVIDTAPLLVHGSPLPLLHQVSGVIGVAGLGQTPQRAVRRMMHLARSAGGHFVGMVATGAADDLPDLPSEAYRPPVAHSRSSALFD